MPPQRVFYAPYGVVVPDSPPRPPRHSRRAFRIAWAGRLEQPQKRVRLLAPILRKLDERGIDYQLRLAGDGPERAHVLEALHPWVEAGRVDYLGGVPAEKVAATVYAGADAFLLTSSWETGPLVIWEAMAAGLPVVSTHYVGSGLEGALRHGENCLLFPIDNATEAANQIARLTDERLRRLLSAGGWQLVTQRYSIPRSVSAWADALNRIMALPPRTSSPVAALPRPAGRLDRLLGIRYGETVRRLLGLRFEHTCPGGEWPHSASGASDESVFLKQASALDLTK
jgi:glycosyltransferase involved in cell wall biosynthesis